MANPNNWCESEKAWNEMRAFCDKCALNPETNGRCGHCAVDKWLEEHDRRKEAEKEE